MIRKAAVGQKKNFLTIISRAGDFVRPNGRKQPLWECLCDCGNKAFVKSENFLSGVTKSCGCLQKTIGRNNKKHGEARITPEYNAWAGMKSRCTDPGQAVWPHYGGRGIKVCERWLNSYESFLLDMGRRPSPQHSIERIDNNGNYEPGNCRWATKAQQMRNTRRNKYLTAFGSTKTISEWADSIGMNRYALYCRIRRGWSPEDAITAAPQKAGGSGSQYAPRNRAKSAV